MKHHAYLGLGSNIDNRIAYIRAALNALDQHEEIKIIKQSSIYETDPVGYEDQGLFLNMVVQIETNLQPEKLLDVCLSIETSLGRKREKRWGPRSIDIDLLLFDQQIIHTEKLTVPHPRMCERGFVTIPLLEIEQNIKLPTMDQPLRLYVKKQNNQKGVRIWKRKNGEGEFVLLGN